MTFRRSSAGALLLTIGMVSLAACRGQPRYTVERVVVGQSPALQGLESLGVDRDALGRTARRLLDAAPGFVPAGKASDGTRRLFGQILVQRAEVRAAGSGPAGTAHVAVTLTLEPTNGEPALRESGRGSAAVAEGPLGLRTALERAATSAIESAVQSFSAQLGAEHKKNSELMRDLGSSEARVRDRAIRVLAERGERDAVPALIASLHDSDADVRERAVGALAQVRDPRAVRPLIELVHHRDAQYVAHMARIIGDIGGADASAWLLTMAFGHPDAAVRSAAHEALAEMAARAPHARATP